MNRPSIDELLPKVDSRYTLVVAAAKRARQLTEGAAPTIHTASTKSVTVALTEILNGTVRCERASQDGH